MAVTTSAAIGLAATAATTGMSFAQRSKQRKLQIKAQEDAKKFMEEARKKIDVNFYDQLSIIKEPYELERDALLASGAQAIEAAKESNRGVAATAGRVAMAQNAGQGQIRTAMGQDLMNLEKMSAAEEARLRDIGAHLDLEEVAGANLAEANAWELEQQALQQGMAGVTSMAGQIAGMPSLYGTEKKWLQGVMGRLKKKDPNTVETGRTYDVTEGTDNQAYPNMNEIKGLSNNSNIQTPVGFEIPPMMNGKTLNPEFQGKSMDEILAILETTGIVPMGQQMDFNQIAEFIYI